jgi:hypothetical protein
MNTTTQHTLRTGKTITFLNVQDKPFTSFSWRNWDYDAAAICARNSETMMYI